jgi:hypothetical protein
MTRFSRVSKKPVVPKKIKLAFDLMLSDPAMTAQLAAKAAGIDYYIFRRALKLPHVAQWARTEHKAKVDAICAANPERLRSIADTSENDMARVASIKTLEQIKGELENPQRAALAGPATTPGVVIVIQGSGGAQMIPPPVPQLVELDPEPRRLQHEP